MAEMNSALLCSNIEVNLNCYYSGVDFVFGFNYNLYVCMDIIRLLTRSSCLENKC